MYKSIATYKDGSWSETYFKEKNDWVNYLLTLFKEPGQYEFDDTALLFND